MRECGSYGRYGVQVFFVISGFVIPFALARSCYQLSDYGRFIAKRIVRLDPPYFVSIAFVVMVGYTLAHLSFLDSRDYTVSIPQLLAHLAYLNVFLDYPWLIPVFWTLAIEFQYYLLMGLVFPVISARAAWLRWLGLISLAALAMIPVESEKWVFRWLFVFLGGIAAFNYRTCTTRKPEFFFTLILAGAGATWINGAMVGSIVTATALSLAFLNVKPVPPLLFLGSISYGLYLLHVPIGTRVLNFSLHFTLGWPGKLFVFSLAAALSIAGAFLLHRWVEAPAQKWSARLPYRHRKYTRGS